MKVLVALLLAAHLTAVAGIRCYDWAPDDLPDPPEIIECGEGFNRCMDFRSRGERYLLCSYNEFSGCGLAERNLRRMYDDVTNFKCCDEDECNAPVHDEF